MQMPFYYWKKVFLLFKNAAENLKQTFQIQEKCMSLYVFICSGRIPFYALQEPFPPCPICSV